MSGEGSAVPVSAHTQVTDLTLHDHACLTFGEQDELLDLTAVFVRDGLASGCRVVILSDAPQVGVATVGGQKIARNRRSRPGSSWWSLAPTGWSGQADSRPSGP